MFGLSLAEVKKTGDCPWCNFRKSCDTLLTLISRFCSRAWWILLFTPVNFSISSRAQTENIFSRSWGWWSRRAWWGSSSASWRAPRSAPPPSCSAGTPSSASAMAPTASYSGFEILIQCWSCSWPDLRVGNMRHTSLVEAHVRAILIRWYLNVFDKSLIILKSLITKFCYLNTWAKMLSVSGWLPRERCCLIIKKNLTWAGLA